jgi:hypothetical protein
LSFQSFHRILPTSAGENQKNCRRGEITARVVAVS